MRCDCQQLVRVVERPWGISVGISTHPLSISLSLPEVELGVNIAVKYVLTYDDGVARDVLCIARCMTPKMWRALDGHELARYLSDVTVALNGCHNACLIERRRCGREKIPPEQYLDDCSFWQQAALPYFYDAIAEAWRRLKAYDDASSEIALSLARIVLALTGAEASGWLIPRVLSLSQANPIRLLRIHMPKRVLPLLVDIAYYCLERAEDGVKCVKTVAELYGEDPRKVGIEVVEELKQVGMEDLAEFTEVDLDFEECKRLIGERPGEAYDCLEKVKERMRALKPSAFYAYSELRSPRPSAELARAEYYSLVYYYLAAAAYRSGMLEEAAKYADRACEEAVKARSILGIYTSCSLAAELHKSTDPEDP